MTNMCLSEPTPYPLGHKVMIWNWAEQLVCVCVCAKVWVGGWERGAVGLVDRVDLVGCVAHCDVLRVGVRACGWAHSLDGRFNKCGLAL